MTTLVALMTKDALVMGCDTLGTITRRLVDPATLLEEFFDPTDDFKLKMTPDGVPVLSDVFQVMAKAQDVPYNHITNVPKLLGLQPMPMGVMYTGVTAIGERTVRSLIAQFRDEDKVIKRGASATNYTVKAMANRLMKFLKGHYDQSFPPGTFVLPQLELLVGGYGKADQTPVVYRLFVHNGEVQEALTPGSFGIVFGGQMKEIQRIVFGTDTRNKVMLAARVDTILGQYRTRAQERVGADLPAVDDLNADGLLDLFAEDFDLERFAAPWGDFSTQNAIECVNFFVEVMTKSQQFSEQLPTVGGRIHMAVVRKEDGFRLISGEEWEHGEHVIEPAEPVGNA